MLGLGSPIPAVSVGAGDGDSGPIQALLDRPTVLVFVKESCETTQMALPVFAQWSRHAPAMKVLAVAQDDPVTTA